MKVKDNLGWQRFFRMMKEWAIFGGLMIVLHLLYALGFVTLDPSDNLLPYIVLSVLYVVCLIGIIVVFWRRLSRADTPLAYREARVNGQPATAIVLEIERTGWHSGRRSHLRLILSLRPFSIRPPTLKYEYQMRLGVMRPGAADYEAQLAEYLTYNQIPRQGDTIAVKVHPQHPEIIVLARD
ncbi:MAG: hypothetical protein L0154_03260 [Chloroflexi bacterium]|nr:hypothetical protein [Chloroflexota bacterium]